MNVLIDLYSLPLFDDFNVRFGVISLHYAN